MLTSASPWAASKRTLVLCACVLGAFILPAPTFGQFDYYTNANNTLIIRRYTGLGGEVVIPSHINGLPVTRLDIYAFVNAFNLTAVTIPNTVTDIDVAAFNYCINLGSVTIPDSVTNISEQAFGECRSLTNVVLSASLKSIEDAVFFDCVALTTITIPASVTNIGESAFFLCYSLPNITLPESVQSLGHNSFGLCGSLTNIVIPPNLTNLNPSAFYGCASLETITAHPLNPGYTSVDGVLFSKNRDLLVKCPDKKSGSYTIPSTVTRIGDYSFALCRGLTNISIPRSVTNLGSWSFSQCDGLSSITIPKSVTQIEDLAFQSCAALHSVVFEGDAPAVTLRSFDDVRFYRMPGTTGWEEFSERVNDSVFLWNPRFETNDPDLGVRNGAFGFSIVGELWAPIVLEAATDLLAPQWTTLQNCTLTNGLIYFSDSQLQDFPSRIYRLRSP
jgi:hypothetical protein